jgi:hypothetical protein
MKSLDEKKRRFVGNSFRPIVSPTFKRDQAITKMVDFSDMN